MIKKWFTTEVTEGTEERFSFNGKPQATGKFPVPTSGRTAIKFLPLCWLKPALLDRRTSTTIV
jgi:hypothetical protein